MSVREIARTIRTVRHLHWSQPIWRLLRDGQRRFEPFAARGSRAAELPPIAAIDRLGALPPPRPPTAPRTTLDLLEQGRLRLLRQTRTLGRVRPDWRLGRQQRDRLWCVTLHYHRWLLELAWLARGRGVTAMRAQRVLIDYWTDWLERCRPDQTAARPLAWNAYAVATRIGWWVQAMRVLGRSFFERHGGLWQDIVASLWCQAAFLAGHLEWDLRGNHLIRDAVGLAWAGRFFHAGRPPVFRSKHVAWVPDAVRDEHPGTPAPRNCRRIDGPHRCPPARWLAAAETLAIEQAAEQILADGGHFERSPMYHLEVIDDLTTIAALLGDRPAACGLKQAVARLVDTAAWLMHPDGELVQFNDGQRRGMRQAATAWSQADRRGRRPRPPRGGRHFSASGWVIWHGPRWSLFFDVGPLGPDCQPGHGHADTLTVDLSYNGCRLFVDPGSYGYDHDARRRYDRSTAAHNTVCVDDSDSSEMWHIFRVGRRARPRDVRVQVTADRLVAEGAHDGYRHLPGRPCHHRRIAVERAGRVEIVDRIGGQGHHRVQGGWLLEPQWKAQPAGRGWRVWRSTDEVDVRIESRSQLSLTIQPAMVHPYYGVEKPAQRLVWRYRGKLPVEVRTVVERGK